MRYVVLGCGAIGATVAAALARDGHDVLVTDPDPQLPHARPTENIPGCRWTGLAQDAVLAAASLTGQPLAETLADPRYRPLFLAIAREVLAQAAVPPKPRRPAGGFDPADLPGSLDWLAQASRTLTFGGQFAVA